MSKLENIPRVDRQDIYTAVFDPAEKQTKARIVGSIRKTGWSDEEQDKVIGALGLQEPKSASFRTLLSQNKSNIVTAIGGLTWGEMLVEQSQKSGLIHNITEWSLLLRNTSSDLLVQTGTRLYDIINALTVSAGSIVKAPVSINDPILFNIMGVAAAAITFGGLGLKGIEKADLKDFKLRTTVERENMTKDGIYPIDKAGHILAFGATDTSLAEPLMGNLKKHGYVVPVHRGKINSYPKANPDGLWACAGIDKSAKTTRNMANREFLLRINAIDASVILVNCMREIGVYQTLDVSDTDNAPEGVMFPQVADAIFEQTTELRKLIYGDKIPSQLFIAAVSRYTTIGQKLFGENEKAIPIVARELFEEQTDEPTVIIEPEELVETELTDIFTQLKSEKGLFKEGIRAAVLAFGDSRTNEQTKKNMVKAFTTDANSKKKIVNEVVRDIKDANVIIMNSTEDIDMTALIQQYRQELDRLGKKDVPIIAILKRPDTRNLASLGNVHTVNVQALISKKADAVLKEKLKEQDISNKAVEQRNKLTAEKRLRKRQKSRVKAVKSLA